MPIVSVLKFRRQILPWFPPGIAVFTDSSALSPRSRCRQSWGPRGHGRLPPGCARSAHQDRVKRNIVLDSRPSGVYIHDMFYSGQQERCVHLRQGFGGRARCSFSGGGQVRRSSGAGGRVRRSLGEGGKNVYFCFGQKHNFFKALYGIHVYFCIPA